MNANLLRRFWNQLHTINRFTWDNHSRAQGGNLKGNGTVQLATPSKTQLLFHEKGVWEGQGIAFTNTYRWTLDENNERISLEHLRFGPNEPVFLLHLVPKENNRLQAAQPHLCKKDLYCATLPWKRDSIRLHWDVSGPEKNETLHSCYTSD